jgi:hypothetical protein
MKNLGNSVKTLGILEISIAVAFTAFQFCTAGAYQFGKCELDFKFACHSIQIDENLSSSSLTGSNVVDNAITFSLFSPFFLLLLSSPGIVLIIVGNFLKKPDSQNS